MAFPVLQATSTGNLTANTVTASLSIMGGVNSGDVLLAVLAVDGNDTVTWDQSAAGTWTAVWDTANSTIVRSTAYWKLADGTEDDKQLKVIFGGAQMYAYHISRWSGVHTSAPFEYTLTFSTTASLSVPSLQVSTVSADYQFVAIAVYDGNVAVSTYPTSYVNTSNPRSANAGGAGIGWSHRSISGSSVVQARYVLASAEDGILTHLSIQPQYDQTVSAGLVASGLTHYAPTLSQPTDQNVDIGLIASGLTHYAPTVTKRLELALPHLGSGVTHYQPSLTLGDITLNLALVASGLTHYQPSLTLGDLNITLPHKASGITYYAPSITGGGAAAPATQTVRLIAVSLDVAALDVVALTGQHY